MVEKHQRMTAEAARKGVKILSSREITGSFLRPLSLRRAGNLFDSTTICKEKTMKWPEEDMLRRALILCLLILSMPLLAWAQRQPLWAP